MSKGPLIVPVLTNISLQFAKIEPDGTIRDLIDALVELEEVKNDILGDLEPKGWAVQSIQIHTNGKIWEEEELETLDTGAKRT
jgi:diaphanous 1